MKDMYSKKNNKKKTKKNKTKTNRTELSIPMKQKALRSHSIYIYKPKNVPERETTRILPNSQIKNLLLLSRSIATTHVLR